ncbi:MAG: SAM-dependent methyltransferase, partial [Paramuribaculum sp.]|nr:SAM-dependent methyltransferase [Paramuribaculum sp.]
MDIFRANGSYNYESLGAIYYILYCLHKGYRIFFSYDNHSNVSDVSIVSQDGQHLKDIILTDFPISNLKPTFIGWSDKHIEQLLLLISNLNVGEEYSSIIENLSQLSLDDMGRKSWDAELPTGIVELVAKISSALSCETIYNPYSKNGSLAIQLHSSSYIGEELYLLNATIARIRLDACHISPEIITLGNPMTHVFPKRCDSVISIPPFMLKQMGSSIELRGTTHKTHTVEDYLLWRYLENEEYRKGIFVFPAGIGFSLRYSEIRETLTKTGCIDTIISLPAGIFHGTGIYTLLLVLNKDKKHDLVKFIDGTKFFVKDKKKNILDVDALFSQYLTPSSNLVYWSNGEEMAYKDFSFSPSMYADYHNEIPEGYNEFDFDKVFRIPQMSPCTTSEEGYVLYPADFSHDYLQIMEGHKDKGTSPNNSYRKSLEPANLAISFLNDTMKIVHLEADAPVFANSNQIPLVVKEDSPIEMEYAIFSLLHNVQFNSLAKQYNGIGMPLRRARGVSYTQIRAHER